jgi:hypothetical protein
MRELATPGRRSCCFISVMVKIHICKGYLSMKWPALMNSICCVKLGKKALETCEILKCAFGEVFLKYTRTFKWFVHFKECRIFIGDDLYSHCQSSCTEKTMFLFVTNYTYSDSQSIICFIWMF